MMNRTNLIYLFNRLWILSGRDSEQEERQEHNPTFEPYYEL